MVSLKIKTRTWQRHKYKIIERLSCFLRSITNGLLEVLTMKVFIVLFFLPKVAVCNPSFSYKRENSKNQSFSCVL